MNVVLVLVWRRLCRGTTLPKVAEVDCEDYQRTPSMEIGEKLNTGENHFQRIHCERFFSYKIFELFMKEQKRERMLFHVNIVRNSFLERVSCLVTLKFILVTDHSNAVVKNVILEELICLLMKGN